MFGPRSTFPTAVFYYLLTERDNYSYVDYLMGPQSFTGHVSRFLDTAPMDIFQVVNPDLYYKMSVNQMFHGRLNLSVQYTDDLDEHLYFFDNPSVTVIILSQLTAAEIEQALQQVAGRTNRYCCLLEPREDVSTVLAKFAEIKFVENVIELTDSLLRDMDDIVSSLARSLPQYAEQLRHYLCQFRTYPQPTAALADIPLFQPTHNAYFMWSQITGNFWRARGNVDHSSEQDLADLREKAEKTKKGDRDARFSLILSEVSKLDRCWIDENQLTPLSVFEPIMNPLILCLPFQNPQGEKLATLFQSPIPAEFLNYLLVEQNFNYVIQRPAPNHRAVRGRELLELAGGAILAPRIRYLDLVSYLHASFTFSPVYRFPLAGKSLNTSLSFLKPDTRNNLNAHNLNKTVAQLSVKLRDHFLFNQLERYLKSRTGQVVAITDLPVELMHIEGLPIIYTHDLCRVPETNYKVGMALYMLQNKFSYQIPEDLSAKTLVILGAPEDPDFSVSNGHVLQLCDSLGINCQPCTGVRAFKELIERFQPEFLIVDCHGQFKAEDLSSYLIINGEKLTHDDIQEIKHVIPLVFLSACSTNPTYGYVHSIANAFFTKGTMSVTTTLLPINIQRGTEFYERILRMLNSAATRGEFPNWLAFMGHITRTAPFIDIYRKVAKQVDRLSDNKKDRALKVMTQLQQIGNRAAAFPTRRETFLRINQLLNNLDDQVRVDFNKIVHEHLLYSHVGRGDLVYFDSWLKRKNQQVTAFVQAMNEPTD